MTMVPTGYEFFMKFVSDQQGIYVMFFFWLYDILTKTRTYLSLKLNVDVFENL